MLFNIYVISLLGASLSGTVSLWLVISRLDPELEPYLAYPLLFISIFFCLAGFCSLVGYWLRAFLFPEEFLLNHFNIALRQGCIIAITILGLIGLHILQTLNVWNGIFFILMSFLLELYFIAQDERI